MIQASILGAESAIAGELLRLLVHHPEVELVSVCSPTLKGRNVTSHHKGLIGDTDLRFCDKIDLEDIDVIFVASPPSNKDYLKEIPEDVKIILLPGCIGSDSEATFEGREFVPGLSEMFRKPLVRGANAAHVMNPAESVALIALYPLALHLLLNDTLKITVELPKRDRISLSAEGLIKGLEVRLNEVQRSFEHIASLELHQSKALRAISVEIEFESNISEEEVVKIYDDIYDDHNFTFTISSDPSPIEVSGTHKCLLHVSKTDDGKIRVKAMADSVLRGGAGDAIHAMNLLFGLFEKTGLSFPAGLAFNDGKHLK